MQPHRIEGFYFQEESDRPAIARQRLISIGGKTLQAQGEAWESMVQDEKSMNVAAQI